MPGARRTSYSTTELEGEPRVTPEVDPERFFRFLTVARIDHKVEARVRGMLQL